MRKIGLTLLVIFLVWTAIPMYAAHASAVVIEDPILEKSIRAKLNKPTGEITEADMASLESFYTQDPKYYGQVRSLKGLEYAVNLKQLNLPGNLIQDIKPLAGLTKLSYLDLDGNHIRDLSALKGLTNMEVLRIGHNYLDSLEAVSDMGSLELIDFADANVSDLSPLRNLLSLTSVNATYNVLNLQDEATKSVIDALKQRNATFEGELARQKTEPSRFTTLDPQLLDWTVDKSHSATWTGDYAYGNGLYVAVGSSGMVTTSKDGIAWQTIETGFRGQFYAVVWGNGKFVAIGHKDSGRKTEFWSSADGKQWTPNEQVIDEFGFYPSDAAWNGKRFVLVGGNNGSGYIYTSEDGNSWTRRASGLIGTDLKGVVWGNGKFVASGYEGGVVGVSKDGLTWTKVKTNQPNYEEIWSLAYGGGTYVLVGDYTIMVSKDGVKWKSVSTKGFWSQIYWVKDRFIVLGFDYVNSRTKDDLYLLALSSKDGEKWTDAGLVNKTDKTQNVSYALHNGKQYVAVTGLGVKTSTDGTHWVQAKKYPVGLDTLNAAAVGAGKLVFVGGHKDRYIKLSSFTSLQLSGAGAWAGTYKQETFPLYSVVWTGSKFLGVGSQGAIRTSADGVNWQNVTSPTTDSLFKIIKAGNAYYAAGANGTILYSSDGVKWTKRKTNTTATLNSMAWSGTAFVAVGQSGIILTSKDGIAWTKVVLGSTQNYYDIAWGKDKFVMTVSGNYVNIDYSKVMVSTDGQKWSTVTFKDGLTLRGDSTGLYGISYVAGYYVAVGPEGSIFLSTDASRWSKQEVRVDQELVGVTEYQGKIYVFGGLGAILSADPASVHTIT